MSVERRSHTPNNGAPSAGDGVTFSAINQTYGLGVPSLPSHLSPSAKSTAIDSTLSQFKNDNRKSAGRSASPAAPSAMGSLVGGISRGRNDFMAPTSNQVNRIHATQSQYAIGSNPSSARTSPQKGRTRSPPVWNSSGNARSKPNEMIQTVKTALLRATSEKEMLQSATNRPNSPSSRVSPMRRPSMDSGRPLYPHEQHRSQAASTNSPSRHHSAVGSGAARRTSSPFANHLSGLQFGASVSNANPPHDSSNAFENSFSNTNQSVGASPLPRRRTRVGGGHTAGAAPLDFMDSSGYARSSIASGELFSNCSFPSSSVEGRIITLVKNFQQTSLFKWHQNVKEIAAKSNRCAYLASTDAKFLENVLARNIAFMRNLEAIVGEVATADGRGGEGGMDFFNGTASSLSSAGPGAIHCGVVRFAHAAFEQSTQFNNAINLLLVGNTSQLRQLQKERASSDAAMADRRAYMGSTSGNVGAGARSNSLFIYNNSSFAGGINSTNNNFDASGVFSGSFAAAPPSPLIAARAGGGGFDTSLSLPSSPTAGPNRLVVSSQALSRAMRVQNGGASNAAGSGGAVGLMSFDNDGVIGKCAGEGCDGDGDDADGFHSCSDGGDDKGPAADGGEACERGAANPSSSESFPPSTAAAGATAHADSLDVSSMGKGAFDNFVGKSMLGGVVHDSMGGGGGGDEGGKAMMSHLDGGMSASGYSIQFNNSSFARNNSRANASFVSSAGNLNAGAGGAVASSPPLSPAAVLASSAGATSADVGKGAAAAITSPQTALWRAGGVNALLHGGGNPRLVSKRESVIGGALSLEAADGGDGPMDQQSGEVLLARGSQRNLKDDGDAASGGRRRSVGTTNSFGGGGSASVALEGALEDPSESACASPPPLTASNAHLREGSSSEPIIGFEPTPSSPLSPQNGANSATRSTNATKATANGSPNERSTNSNSQHSSLVASSVLLNGKDPLAGTRSYGGRGGGVQRAPPAATTRYRHQQEESPSVWGEGAAAEEDGPSVDVVMKTIQPISHAAIANASGMDAGLEALLSSPPAEGTSLPTADVVLFVGAHAIGAAQPPTIRGVGGGGVGGASPSYGGASATVEGSSAYVIDVNNSNGGDAGASIGVIAQHMRQAEAKRQRELFVPLLQQHQRQGSSTPVRGGGGAATPRGSSSTPNHTLSKGDLATMAPRRRSSVGGASSFAVKSNNTYSPSSQLYYTRQQQASGEDVAGGSSSLCSPQPSIAHRLPHYQKPLQRSSSPFSRAGAGGAGGGSGSFLVGGSSGGGGSGAFLRSGSPSTAASALGSAPSRAAGSYGPISGTLGGRPTTYAVGGAKSNNANMNNTTTTGGRTSPARGSGDSNTCSHALVSASGAFRQPHLAYMSRSEAASRGLGLSPRDAASGVHPNCQPPQRKTAAAGGGGRSSPTSRTVSPTAAATRHQQQSKGAVYGRGVSNASSGVGGGEYVPSLSNPTIVYSFNESDGGSHGSPIGGGGPSTATASPSSPIAVVSSSAAIHRAHAASIAAATGGGSSPSSPTAAAARRHGAVAAATSAAHVDDCVGGGAPHVDGWDYLPTNHQQQPEKKAPLQTVGGGGGARSIYSVHAAATEHNAKARRIYLLEIIEVLGMKMRGEVRVLPSGGGGVAQTRIAGKASLTSAEVETAHRAFIEVYGEENGTRQFYAWMAGAGRRS